MYTGAAHLRLKAVAFIYSDIWRQYDDSINSLANPFNNGGKHEAVYSTIDCIDSGYRIYTIYNSTLYATLSIKAQAI